MRLLLVSGRVIRSLWPFLGLFHLPARFSEVAKEGTTTNSRRRASSCSLFSKVASAVVVVVGGGGGGGGGGWWCCRLAGTVFRFGVFYSQKDLRRVLQRDISSWRGWGRYLQHLEGPPGGSVQHEIVFTGVKKYKFFLSQYLVSYLSIAWEAQHIVSYHILESFCNNLLFHIVHHISHSRFELYIYSTALILRLF